MAKAKFAHVAKNASRSPYDILVERILMGEYMPGTSLSEQDISHDLGVSRTPVREALLRLRIEGLVRIVPRGGIFVAEATLRRVREVTSLRLVLEEYLARLVVERRSEAWLDKVQDWIDSCRAKWESFSPRDLMQKDGEFHLFLEEAAGDDVLASHLGLLRRQAVLFWGQTTDGRASLHSISKDFEGILQAIKQRDVEKCVRALHSHVLAHVDRIQTYMRPELKTTN